jgi:hypothetical protein
VAACILKHEALACRAYDVATSVSGVTKHVLRLNELLGCVHCSRRIPDDGLTDNLHVKDFGHFNLVSGLLNFVLVEGLDTAVVNDELALLGNPPAARSRRLGHHVRRRFLLRLSVLLLLGTQESTQLFSFMLDITFTDFSV